MNITIRSHYRTGHNYRRILMVVGTPRNFENNQIVEMQFFIDYNERRGLQAILGIFLISSALAGPLSPSEDSFPQGNAQRQKSCRNAAETAVH